MHRPDTFPERVLYLQRLLPKKNQKTKTKQKKKFLTYTLPPPLQGPTGPLKLLINASGRQFLSIQSSPYLIIFLCQIINGELTVIVFIQRRWPFRRASDQQLKATAVRVFPANFPAFFAGPFGTSRVASQPFNENIVGYMRESFFVAKTKQQQNAESMKHISRKGKKRSKIFLFCL